MKNRKLVVIGAVAAMTVIAGCSGQSSSSPEVTVTQQVTVAPSVPQTQQPTETQPPSTETPPEPPASSETPSETSPTESSPTESAPPTAEGKKPTNIPMTKLEPGEKAPQFIIFSFDGAGSHTKWQEFFAAAEPHDARFVAFLTGIYLVTDSNADWYHGPQHEPGQGLGFGGDGAEVATRIGDLNLAYERGMEIGTHYNGHFCGPGGGNDWNTAEWKSEIKQAIDIMTTYREVNPDDDLPTLNVPPSEIKGGRLPCLEGVWDEVLPAWQEYGFTYDSSYPAPLSGIYWPEKVDGIWEFYMPTVYSPGFGGMVMAMDYNFWFKFNQAKEEPGRADELTAIVKGTYAHMYEEAFNGNRAPVLIANHFNNWNGNALNPAVLQFMEDYCGEPDTYCATYQDVIAWMELQDPDVLASLQAQAPVAATG